MIVCVLILIINLFFQTAFSQQIGSKNIICSYILSSQWVGRNKIDGRSLHEMQLQRIWTQKILSRQHDSGFQRYLIMLSNTLISINISIYDKWIQLKWAFALQYIVWLGNFRSQLIKHSCDAAEPWWEDKHHCMSLWHPQSSSVNVLKVRVVLVKQELILELWLIIVCWVSYSHWTCYSYYLEHCMTITS